jgi:hypothetical protein
LQQKQNITSEQSEIFQLYLAGDSLLTIAKKTGAKASHPGIGHILRNRRYLGDGFYPPLIDPEIFAAVESERTQRAEKLKKHKISPNRKQVLFPTSFRLLEGNQQFEDPFQQATYAYSLIERR